MIKLKLRNLFKIKNNKSQQLRRNMRYVFWLFFVMFICLSVYFLKIIFIDSKSIITNPYNARLSMTDNSMRRGSILDSQGNVIAETELNDSGYYRLYPYGNILCHFIGYNAYGKAGMESKFNFKLQKPQFELYQRFMNIATDKEIVGNNIITTIDAPLSEYIRNLLDEQKGAVVVMEPPTGKVVSMISYPNFYPEGIEGNWSDLNLNPESPLLNRSTQGIYSPGSTYKILTTIAALESRADWQTYLDEYTYECTGEGYFDEERLRCFNSIAHGTVDFRKAFALSCNTFFASVALETPNAFMRKVSDDFYITKPYDLILDYSIGSFDLDDDATVGEIIQTSIGQGKTLVTPMNMAMVTSAIANNGIMMKPYVTDRVETPTGTIVEKTYPTMLGQVVSIQINEVIQNMMIECVATGTGTGAKVEGITLAGKTGTAQNPAGDDHSWFIGYFPAENPEYAFSILLENSGEKGKATSIAKKIVEYFG